MTELGALVRRERTRQGWTLEVLGEVLGKSTSYLSEIERGTRAPSDDGFLARLSAALSLPWEAVWYAADKIPPGYRHGLDDDHGRLLRAWAAFRAELLLDADEGAVVLFGGEEEERA